MKKCNFKSEPNPNGGNTLTCIECGRVVSSMYKTATARCPKPKPQINNPAPYDPNDPNDKGPISPSGFINLGNIVSSVLESVGITKELVTKITGTQKKPGGCGCKKRQEDLNKMGHTIQEKISDGVNEIKKIVGLNE